MQDQYHCRVQIPAMPLLITKELTFISESERTRFFVGAAAHGIHIIAVWEDKALSAAEAIESVLSERGKWGPNGQG